MLDSTGIHGFQDVECVFCPKTVVIPYYQPEYGHDGYKLENLGPYIDWGSLNLHSPSKDKVQFLNGKIIRLAKSNGHLRPEEVNFEYDGNSYSYGRPKLPEINLAEKLTFWVCPDCIKLAGADSETVRESLVSDLISALDRIHICLGKKAALFVGANRAANNLLRAKG